jgi:hypothetical protein
MRVTVNCERLGVKFHGPTRQIHPWCSIGGDGSLPLDSFRARRMLLMELKTASTARQYAAPMPDR